MSRLSTWLPWREAFVVLGVCLIAYGGSEFSGSVSGSLEGEGRGSFSGVLNYRDESRQQITVGAGLLSIGILARIGRRSRT